MLGIQELIPPVDSKYGAPKGRPNIGIEPKDIPLNQKGRPKKVIYDRAVPMSRCGAYDMGGAYWGIGSQLRVKFTKDLSYIEFYRKD